MSPKHSLWHCATHAYDYRRSRSASGRPNTSTKGPARESSLIRTIAISAALHPHDVVHGRKLTFLCSSSSDRQFNAVVRHRRVRLST